MERDYYRAGCLIVIGEHSKDLELNVPVKKTKKKPHCHHTLELYYCFQQANEILGSGIHREKSVVPFKM